MVEGVGPLVIVVTVDVLVAVGSVVTVTTGKRADDTVVVENVDVLVEAGLLDGEVACFGLAAAALASLGTTAGKATRLTARTPPNTASTERAHRLTHSGWAPDDRCVHIC